MQKFQDVATIIGPPGLIPIVGANVDVYVTGTSTHATLYNSNSTNSPTGNPLTTDASGLYSFYAQDGRYDRRISGNGIQSTLYTDLMLGDGVTNVTDAPGVDPTGNTDSTTGIQSIINAAVAANAACVVFPPGTYKTTGLSITNYAGQNLAIIGYGARILLGANQVGFAISGSQNIQIRGFSFYSALASGASQSGISCTLSSRIRIVDNDFRLLTYGVNFVSSTLGLAISTSIPLGMSLISRNTINACATGILLAGSSNVTAAEYVSASGNMIDACTARGILVQAGNARVSDNTVVGNIIGIEIDGSQYANADHGAVIGNTINHSSSCGLYVHDTSAQYSYLITGNNIWATIYTNLGVGNYAHPFGVVLKNCASINFTNNIVARNVVNLGIDVLTSSFIANNNFLTDSANTIFNIYEITALTVANGNKMAPNTFNGTLVASANNNDYEQTYNIGVAGSPAFQNTWANFGSGFTTAAYRKDAAGFVHLSGVVSGGTMNLAIFTLPVNFRPLTNDFTQVTVCNNLIGRVLVSHTGDVIPAVGNNTWFSIDGISFKAEA